MSILRKSARLQPCTVRMPGICNFNPETTVLAHLNGAGMGIKHSDLFGAFCCSACHDEYDRRTMHKDRNHAELCFYQGMQQTQQWWLDNGYVVTK